jgi:DNA-3-methyladenine glycosylase
VSRAFFDRPAEQVAPDLLGRVLERESAEGVVAVRLTEVEAYAGSGDAASHAYRGKTARTAVMFGPPGHAYVYFTYGMHYCVNLVCLGEGSAAAVLVRAGEVVRGHSLAQARRPRADHRDLARGPARLCTALGIGREFNGADICAPDGPLRLLPGAAVNPDRIAAGPRTGVNGAKEVPWRFWVTGERTVSPYRPHTPRRRAN